MNRTELLQDRRMRKFKDVFERWQDKRLSGQDAAEILGMSERSFRRYRDRFEEDGLIGLSDRRLGKPSPRRVPGAQVARMKEIYAQRFMGWSVKHFHEHMCKHYGFQWSYTWTKKHLHASGLVRQATRRGAHRRKRPRKPCEGMMLHQDASRHAWLPDLGNMDLVVTLDDATSAIYSAILVEEEGTFSTFEGLLEVFMSKGLPASLYTDRGSHYFLTPKADEAVDKSRLTQVGRALKHLGIEHIPAYSPEARGRSERAFGTLQDRLPKELSLANITTVKEANRFLREEFVPAYNAQFAKPPELPESAFVPVRDRLHLIECLCIEDERIVSRDNTVSYGGLRLQIPESPMRAHFVKARVRVRQYPDGTLSIFYGAKCLGRYSSAGEFSPSSVTRYAA